MCYFKVLSICAQNCVCMLICEDVKFEKKRLSVFIALTKRNIYNILFHTSLFLNQIVFFTIRQLCNLQKDSFKQFLYI